MLGEGKWRSWCKHAEQRVLVSSVLMLAYQFVLLSLCSCGKEALAMHLWQKLTAVRAGRWGGRQRLTFYQCGRLISTDMVEYSNVLLQL